MATKKEALTKDEKGLLAMAAGLCLLKTAVEQEIPLGGADIDALKTLAVGAFLNFGQLMDAAKERDALPRLRAAVDKAKANMTRRK